MNELDSPDWNVKLIRDSVKDLNRMLRQIATLDFTLTSAYLGLWNQISIFFVLRVLICLLLIAALTFSLVGMYPFGMNVRPTTDEEAAAAFQKSASTKRIWLFLSIASLLGSFLIFWFARVIS